MSQMSTIPQALQIGRGSWVSFIYSAALGMKVSPVVPPEVTIIREMCEAFHGAVQAEKILTGSYGLPEAGGVSVSSMPLPLDQVAEAGNTLNPMTDEMHCRITEALALLFLVDLGFRAECITMHSKAGLPILWVDVIRDNKGDRADA